MVDFLRRFYGMLGRLTSAYQALLLRIKGRKKLVTTRMNKMSVEVTSVRLQLHVKAIIIAAVMVEKNSTKTPSFSEIPSCSTLALLVIVPVA